MIGAFGQETVACPRCPICDAEPTDWSREIRPWFCSAGDECKVLTWNPDRTLDENIFAMTSIHDIECPLAGRVVTDGRDPRCTCFAT